MAETLARLVERSGEHRARVHELGLGRYVIGRGAGVDLALDHGDVSRRHAELEIRPDGARVRDLGSKNGVRVEGQAIPEQRWSAVDDGAWLRLGDLHLQLEHAGARVDRLLARSKELTIRRPVAAGPVAEARAADAPSLLLPLLASAIFAVLVAALLLFG